MCCYGFVWPAPPRITQQPQAKLELTTGDELLLTCDAECEPPEPQFQWFKRQTPIPMATSKTLRIRRVNENYTEVYVCRVMNPHINNSQKATMFSNFSQVKVYPLNKSSLIQQGLLSVPYVWLLRYNFHALTP